MRLQDEPFDLMEEHTFLKEHGCYEYDPTLSIAYTRNLFKTACLFFDRIYLDIFDYNNLRIRLGHRFPVDALYLDERISGGIAQYMDLGFSGKGLPPPEQERYAFTVGLLECAKQHGVTITPIYGTIYPGEQWSSEEDENSVDTIDLLLSAFPMVNENSLTWEQVDEFRADTESVGGFRGVRTLLYDLRECRSTIEISDTLEWKIKAYERACSKHGLSLVRATLNQVFRKDTVIAALGAGFMTGDVDTGTLVGGLKLATDMSLNLASSVKDRRALMDQNVSGAAAIGFRDLNTRIEQGQSSGRGGTRR